MTEEAVGLLYRGIIQFMAGDEQKSEKHVLEARKLSRSICVCGEQMALCKYKGRKSRLCTNCGLVWQNGKVVKKTNAKGRRSEHVWLRKRNKTRDRVYVRGGDRISQKADGA